MVVFLAVDEVEAMRLPVAAMGLPLLLLLIFLLLLLLQVQLRWLLLLLLLLPLPLPLFLLLTCRVPFRSGGQRGEKPRRGGVHGCTPSAAGAGCPFRGSPGWPRTRSALARRARRQGVLSFGYFSLHKQRKVTRRKAKAFAPASTLFCRSGFSRERALSWSSRSRLKPLLQFFSPTWKLEATAKAFALSGELLFFARAKKR
ncbi:hypothetical protein [Xanthomonas sacchari]|uniref:hypothetical protein n=1 Tax=Xanthomonas sacchari TaxID=56458 RepID=UPI003B226B09